MKFILNGRFMAQPFSGVQRFAYEILKQFAIMKDAEVIVAMPSDAAAPTVLSENIEYVTVGKRTGTMWEQLDLPRFCKKRKLPLLCTGNTAPMRYRSYVVLHDLLWLDMKKCVPKRSWRIKSKLMIRSFIYRSHCIFTLTEFSAGRIESRFPRLKRPPTIVYTGAEHVREWKETPVSSPERFFLSVGSVYEHKNFRFVLELAKRNPDRFFVIVGKKNTSYDDFLKENKIENCIFTGYVDDGQLAYLYHRCEGFILPSLYEGFGIPPLEALACGCRTLLLSDIPVFRECYGKVANFCDPYDPASVSLSELKAAGEEETAALLQRFSWKNTAERIYRELKR